MEKIRVIQIGAGRFGASWMKVVCESDQAELAAVVDVVPENLQNASSIANLPASKLFTSLESAVQAVDADMVLIVTPPKTHKSIALQALRTGLHVVLEKPVTHSLEEAVELRQAGIQYGKKVMVSQNYRWRPSIQTLKRLLREEAVGRIGYIEYAFRRAVKIGGWRDEMNEVLLEDMSLHHFDLLRYLLDKEAVEVYAQSFRPHWSWFSGNPTASVNIRFEDDIRVHYFGSWVNKGAETTWNGDIRIVGDQGTIEMSQDQIRIWKDEENAAPIAVKLDELPYGGDRLASLHDFVQAIREDRTPLTSISDNIHTFGLTCAAIHSAQSDEKIRLNDFYGKMGVTL
ncbi:Gfo/Idh/MocA family protein [Paenibacillus piri]|uniref:Gfo/Idh/MocA family oxidoreductase n=1 Tax=Paenibacillus piri TaxID=2547395 RepID=A0A4R5KBI7_9BACL|nr:Gfo/Idh/MocA family oxidoreductase [Paenibacillus piri]TDF92549.1 Gfo/Idh/MocA family oxidoreductase [Paenibacillus piri]